MAPGVKTMTQLRFYISTDTSDKPDTNPPYMLTMRRAIAACVDAEYVLTTMLTAMAIGMLCARSLHYQFFAYIAWATPYLLYRAKLHPVVIYGVWAAQEWAWNVYPSTEESSMVVVGCLAVQVLGVLWATRNKKLVVPVVEKGGGGEQSHSHAE
jgi:alpha-1,3-mannosyltransferase